MGDQFLERFSERAQSKYYEQSFDLDLSEYDEAFDEVWTIKPVSGKIQDKIIPIYVRDNKLYEAIATTILYRACKQGTTIRRFKSPKAIDTLMADTEFLDWFAGKIRFHEEMQAFLTGEEEQEALKNSDRTTGSTES